MDFCRFRETRTPKRMPPPMETSMATHLNIQNSVQQLVRLLLHTEEGHAGWMCGQGDSARACAVECPRDGLSVPVVAQASMQVKPTSFRPLRSVGRALSIVREITVVATLARAWNSAVWRRQLQPNPTVSSRTMLNMPAYFARVRRIMASGQADVKQFNGLRPRIPEFRRAGQDRHS